jgi:hypothetical protein
MSRLEYSIALIILGGAFLFFLYGMLVPWPLQAQTPPQPQSQSPIVTVPGTPPPVNVSKPNQSAVSVQEVKSPAAPSHYTDQAIWGIMASFVLRYVTKKAWFPWLTEQSSTRLKTQFGFVVAFLTAAGIHFAVSGSVLDGGAAITVSGLSINAFKDLAWQWTAQQTAYQLVVKEAKI